MSRCGFPAGWSGWSGANGMNALTKFMGFLLLCIGVQFIVNGVINIATDPAVLQSIRSSLPR